LWQFAPLTALKKFERLRSFFRFCHTAKWMSENPALAIKAPKADTPPEIPRGTGKPSVRKKPHCHQCGVFT
jgi:site-specific recombinase XerD